MKRNRLKIFSWIVVLLILCVVWQFTVAQTVYQPADKPALYSPANGSTYTGSAPTLSWNSVSSPSGGQVKYYVETFDSPNSQNSGWITGTSWTPSTTIPGLYNWHVKAIDTNTGKESGYGSVWQFTVAQTVYKPADKPVLYSPSNGSTYTGSAPTLSWNSVSSPSGGQVKYYVETFDSPNSQNSGWITGTSWTPSTTTAGLYNWHVKAIDVNTGKESGYGGVWQFSIIALIASDKLPSPSALYCDHVTNHDLEVRWNTVTGANKYNIYLNGQFWGYTDSTTYVAGNLTANTEYWVKVYAVDASGNEGLQSDNIRTRTSS